MNLLLPVVVFVVTLSLGMPRPEAVVGNAIAVRVERGIAILREELGYRRSALLGGVRCREPDVNRDAVIDLSYNFV